MDLEALTDRLEAAFIRTTTFDDPSHDIHHARRVGNAAFAIADGEAGDADRAVLLAAAYLHDLVNLPKNAPNRAQASRLSAEAATPILVEIGFDDDAITAIRHAIEAHSFSAGIEPTTLEACIVQDADRLEALGAIGIARTFLIAGQLGADLFDGEDPFADRRPLDDRRFALDHFAVKLLRLPDTMRTESGRAMARERAETIRAFLAALGAELGHRPTW